MTRLPFNPDLVREPPREQAFSVTAVSNLIKQAVADALPAKVRVIGQISNLSSRQHWFFSLKDDGATLRCVCFASSVRQIKCDVKDGMEVIATGRLDYYPQQSQLQLYVEKIEPVGQGALDARYKALCEELRSLGYFEASRKKPLPFMPRRIAVVTSRSAAALQDVRDTAARRWAGVELLLYDVRVQGESAAGQIASAIDNLSRHGASLDIEAIILTRGGGSIEDLWAFNERIVADAIFRCKLPIVAAIGHETDTTIAELVADMRCATPTQAATVLVPDRKALGHQVDQLSARLTQRVGRELKHHRQRLAAAVRHRLFRQPQRLIEPIHEQVKLLSQRLTRALQFRLEPAARAVEQGGAGLSSAMQRRLTQDVGRFAALERQLHTIGPRSVLARGYSYTLDAQGRLVRHAADAKAGEHITTMLVDGSIRSTVDGAPPKRRTRTEGETAQPSLFSE